MKHKFRLWNGKEMFNSSYASLSNGVLEFDWAGEVMQFTGQLDKNGVEIFEGDLVKDDKGKIYEVIWDDFMFNLDGFYDVTFDYPSIAFSEGVFEVIGNKYQNLELLKTN